MLLKHLQHMQHHLIYFCNIHKKQLQHTFETTETPKTYICALRGKAWVGRFQPSGSGTGGE
jgi:hypothetical protein